jgi:hypothetical protein
MPGGRQYISYDAAARDACLVEIAKTLGKWRQQLPVKLQLQPDNVVSQAIRPHIGKPGFRCIYRIYQNGVESAPKDTSIIPFKGGLFVPVAGLAPLASVQISIDAAGKTWTTDYESVDAVSIVLREV